MEHIHETAQAIRQRLLDQLQRDEPVRAIPSTYQNSECPHCGGDGWLSTENGVSPCCCRIRRIRQGKLCGIPERFRDSTFENFRAPTAVLADRCKQLEREPTRSVFLFGDYGAGKTHLAIAHYRAHIEADLPAMFFSMAELLRELQRAALDPEYLCIVQQRARYAEHFHLFVDDIEKFKVTDFKYEALFDLLDTIYRRNLGLTVTSNYSLADLVQYEKLHPAIVRRIDDMCEAWDVSHSGIQRGTSFGDAA